MKLHKAITLAILFWFVTGCQVDVTGPYTGTKYSIGVDPEEGVVLKAKPFGWDLLTNP